MSREVFQRPTLPVPPGPDEHWPRATLGQRAAESVASFVGSWKFIIGQSVVLAVWVLLNVTAYIHHWDPYPFILMNLCLSLQAAYTAPMILMAQNRQAEHDRAVLYDDHNMQIHTSKQVDEALRVLADLQVWLSSPPAASHPHHATAPDAKPPRDGM